MEEASEKGKECPYSAHGNGMIEYCIDSVDKKNQLDATFCILYFSSNSCSTCFGATMCPSSGADDVWLTAHRDSVWIRKIN